MIEVKDILNKAIGLGACSQSSKATDWKSLVWLFSLLRDVSSVKVLITLHWRCFA